MSESPELQHAYSLLQQRKLNEAESRCRAVLRRAPLSAAAIHLLGLIRKERGDWPDGEQLLLQSTQLDPLNAEYRTNLANLLRRTARAAQAELCYREACRLNPAHLPARFGLALSIHDQKRYRAAEEECRLLVTEHPRHAETWALLALALNNQGRALEAEQAYRQSLACNPAYGLAHHNLGALLSRMERAEEALQQLDQAQLLGISGAELHMNRGRTLALLYRVEEAEAEFAQAIELDPMHMEAQTNLARLRFMRCDPDFARGIAAVAARRPDDVPINLLYAELLKRAGNNPAAEAHLRRAIGKLGPNPELHRALAEVLHESGRLPQALSEARAALAGPQAAASTIESLVAILLSNGQAAEAQPHIRAQRLQQPLAQQWLAYEATAARMLGLATYHELYDYERLVRSYQLEPPAGWSSMEQFHGELLDVLNIRHPFATHPLDQSLRNGSQTARSLLQDSDPHIKAILAAFAPSITDYLDHLGSDPSHPLSARNTGHAALFSAWSIRLHRDGFHVNHIHPQGWLSSAYYVSVPDETEDEITRAGWLKLGETRWPIPEILPERFVRPRAGLLVLFPSYMWHGTIPILGSQARTTIAFDAIPAQ